MFTRAFLLCAGAVWAWTPGPWPTFEVASIKPSGPGSQGVISRFSGGRFTTSKIPLRTLIAWAYDKPESQIVGGPAWLNSERFDISATPETDAGVEQGERDRQIKLMVQALLADRFQLVIEPETRELPVYVLTPAKGGPKLRENSGEPYMIRNTSRKGFTRIVFQKISMNILASQLSGQFGAEDLGRNVLDKTGLEGVYDFTLAWTPSSAIDPAPGSPPSLFSAVQEQLGLRLQAEKGPVQVLTIVRVEHPSDN